ncbi:MAG: hypothetical protein HFH68_05620 [Lachnospiraceae bacterium]|nr:hypothetical protein [Lachnospiraceae bacterium]
MSYINANTILPVELIENIQKYVNGVNLYIPKVPEEKSACSSYKQETNKRNQEIYGLFMQGMTVKDLAVKFYLSDKSIYRILGKMKNK